MSKEELEVVKKLIRATLISSPKSCMTVNELYFQYKEVAEDEIPFRKFNFRSTFQFLQSMPDTVRVSEVPTNHMEDDTFSDLRVF